MFAKWGPVGIVQSSNNPKKEITGRLKTTSLGKDLKEAFPVLATAVQLMPSNVGRLLDEPRVTDFIDSFGRTRGV
jgi:hypothetical protein